MKRSVKQLTVSALIAAFYAVFTLSSSALGLAYGPIQFRLSEAMTILPVFTPAAVPGLVIGCVLANLTSPYGLVDICFGTLATLLAAVCTRLLRNLKIKGLPVLSALMPVIFNAVIIGAEIAMLMPDATVQAKWVAFGYNALTVGLGESVICLGLGLPLYIMVNKYAKHLFRN
ncbi:MAG: QueT transporter family protein [Clostridia bacterium]|nr:QueT transporter family protein [Clostridia bacterium]